VVRGHSKSLKLVPFESLGAVSYSQGCRGYGDSHGYGCGMGMGTMMNPNGSVGIPWGFLNGFRITWKRVKYSAFL